MRWWLPILLFLSVASAHAQGSAKPVVASRFIAGEWKLSCSAAGLPGGVTINGNRIASAEFGWGCVFLELSEESPSRWHRGPTWAFRARCDLASEKPPERGSPSGYIQGTLELRYPDNERKRTELTMGIDRPSSGGLLSLFAQNVYGPFVRCAE
jgi:hypothetical protein